tara:strand:- start:574 stop:795 length:222 start_codon:yes stop_codon:yes gene_type:complete
MKSVISSINWANGGMADTQVLGTCLARGFGSSPNSPTRSNNWKSIVAQGVALAITCCTTNAEKEIFKGKTIGH